MVSPPAAERTAKPVEAYVPRESSAFSSPFIDRPVVERRSGIPAAEILPPKPTQQQPAEHYVEARQTGTDGPGLNNAVILPFNPPAPAEPAKVPHREEALAAVPAPAPLKAKRATPKPRVKPEIKTGLLPENAPGTKPPRVGVNIEWVQKGVGWDCREVYYVGKQRRRRHLGHIGRQKWEEMRQQHSGKALEDVLREWIEARRAEKSMSLSGE